MRKDSARHTARDFGRSPTSGGAMSGMDGPMIGASASIMVDALAEQESGVTPPPPRFTVKALGVAFLVMFLLGAVVLGVLVSRDKVTPRPRFRLSFGANGMGSMSGTFGGLDQGSSFYVEPGLAPGADPVGFAFDSSTVFLLNGQQVPLSSADERVVTLAQVGTWPVRVEYVRAKKGLPHATRVEFAVP